MLPLYSYGSFCQILIIPNRQNNDVLYNPSSFHNSSPLSFYSLRQLLLLAISDYSCSCPEKYQVENAL